MGTGWIADGLQIWGAGFRNIFRNKYEATICTVICSMMSTTDREWPWVDRDYSRKVTHVSHPLTAKTDFFTHSPSQTKSGHALFTHECHFSITITRESRVTHGTRGTHDKLLHLYSQLGTLVIVLQNLYRLVCLDVVKMSSQSFQNGKQTTNIVNKIDNFDDQLKAEMQNRHDWKLVSLIVDRYLMLIFSMTTVVITVSLLIYIAIGSEEEFQNEITILNNSWKITPNVTNDLLKD